MGDRLGPVRHRPVGHRPVGHRPVGHHPVDPAMLTELEEIKTDALAAIGDIDNEPDLEQARVGFLGKKGCLTAASAGMRDVPKEQKKDVGQKLNEVRTAIT